MVELTRFWRWMTQGLWFVPLTMLLGGCALALAAVASQGSIGDALAARLPLLLGAGASGARGVLEAIATSVITVAGVIFSVTVVTLSLATRQYTPRVLRNYLEDRSIQVVLGFFVGLYGYCLVVLRAIREEGFGGFVPSLAVLVAILLALVGTGMLVYFIHHIASAVQASHIIANVHAATARAIERLFPEELGGGADPTRADRVEAELAALTWTPVRSLRAGYVAEVHGRELVELVEDWAAVVRIVPSIGAFVRPGAVLLWIAGHEPTPRDEGRLRRAVVIAPSRSIYQDVAFGLRELVDIAGRAASDSSHDMTTAVMCVDYIGALLAALATRRMPSPYRHDQRGKIRIVAPAPELADLLREAYRPVLRYAGGDPDVLEALVRALALVQESCVSPARRRLVAGALDEVLAEASRAMARNEDRERLTGLARALGPERKPAGS